MHHSPNRPILGLAFEANAAQCCVTQVDADGEVQGIACFAPSGEQACHALTHSQRQAHSLPSWIVDWQRVIEEYCQTVLDERPDGTLEPVNDATQTFVI